MQEEYVAFAAQKHKVLTYADVFRRMLAYSDVC
jgi:hypothetical protein